MTRGKTVGILFGSLLGLAALSAAALLVPAPLNACAVCLDGAANDPVSDAFNWSVLFMMASPYAIFGTIGGWIFYRQRRGGSEQAGGERSGEGDGFKNGGRTKDE